MPSLIQKSEKDIQSSILNHLKKKIFCWRNNSGVTVIQHRFIRFGAKGAPDIIGVLPDGRFLGIEVKKPGGPVRPEQKVFIDLINKNKGLAFIAHDLQEVKVALSGYITS